VSRHRLDTAVRAKTNEQVKMLASPALRLASAKKARRARIGEGTRIEDSPGQEGEKDAAGEERRGEEGYGKKEAPVKRRRDFTKKPKDSTIIIRRGGEKSARLRACVRRKGSGRGKRKGSRCAKR